MSAMRAVAASGLTMTVMSERFAPSRSSRRNTVWICWTSSGVVGARSKVVIRRLPRGEARMSVSSVMARAPAPRVPSVRQFHDPISDCLGLARLEPAEVERVWIGAGHLYWLLPADLGFRHGVSVPDIGEALGHL